MINKDQIRTLAQERIDELDCGIFIVDILVTPKNQIFVELDKMGMGIAINECVSVSRNIEHNLDREVEDFELQVSSAGMDKPLRVKQQYEKNLGRKVKAVLAHGSFEGILKAFDDASITIETETKEKIEGKKKKEIVIAEHKLDFADIKEVKRVIEFGKLDKK